MFQYIPETILKPNPEKTAYHNFITRTDDKHSDLVLLELSDKKENYEIVNYHVIRNKKLRKIIKARMGGQPTHNKRIGYPPSYQFSKY
ncbi:hypothetical protein [uncultured Brachyspira sp.]|uniref:hypothetical protein n=1 Tax=uncultured Brachyspira sp. TaxID=221953 RepID=UPI00261A48B7|nr:hypothetical protein [uncultured Brachyspira sp.]